MEKRLFMISMLLMIGLAGYAQADKGKSSIGFNVGYAFDTKNATLALDYKYCLTDEFRLGPSLTYFVKNDGLSAWAIDLNANYLFKINEMFAFYPLAGLDLSFWKWDLGSKLSKNLTRFGANIGLGGEVFATENFVIGLEVKYLIIKSFDQPMFALRAAYCF